MVTDRRVIEAPYRDITKDPRADEKWFLRLPPEIQDRTREVWPGCLLVVDGLDCCPPSRMLPWKPR